MITKNTRIFLTSFIGSIPLWMFFNFSIQELNTLPTQTLSANLQESLHIQKLHKKTDASEFSSNARAALSVYVNTQDKTQTLFSKDSDTPFPVASLTKLMAALVVAERYPIDQTVQNLLSSMLIESSNEAAANLANIIGNDFFVYLMNVHATKLSLFHSSFYDPTGIDPDAKEIMPNTMSAKDVALLGIYLKEYYPEIFYLLSKDTMNIHTPAGTLDHIAKNTNELLGESSFPLEILGGKTGETPLSKGCLFLIIETPNKNGYIVNVILGSEERFKEMKDLVQWIIQSYDF